MKILSPGLLPFVPPVKKNMAEAAMIGPIGCGFCGTMYRGKGVVTKK